MLPNERHVEVKLAGHMCCFTDMLLDVHVAHGLVTAQVPQQRACVCMDCNTCDTDQLLSMLLGMPAE